jgi:hypothetical protein
MPPQIPKFSLMRRYKSTGFQFRKKMELTPVYLFDLALTNCYSTIK